MLLSAGMLFFFTLGSSMVGDICDEDELKTGYRAEGSFYSIFWWFIKMGTALASFVAGSLIVLTLFDQTQVTKVDSLQGSIRELHAEVKSRMENKPSANLEGMIGKAKMRSNELMSELQIKAKADKNSKEHYQMLIRNITGINYQLAKMNPASPLDFMDKRLFAIEREMVFLKKQTPYTLLMMRVFEIGLPVLLSLFSIFFVMRYSLTEKRSHEIKDLLIQRNLQRLKDEDSETIAT
jgi:GPH family glycoside/pentoside/hexuronide:cation symporter